MGEWAPLVFGQIGIGQMNSHTAIHSLSESNVFAALDTRPEGLNEIEIAERRQRFGPNRLQSPSPWRHLRLFAKHFLNLFSILLGVASAACFIADSLQPEQGMRVLGYVLLGVAMLNAVFAFAQELRAENAMDSLKDYLPRGVRVIRSGSERVILSEELVPGDVVLLVEGDRVAADTRVLFAESLLVNNAPLTGESRSVSLFSAPSKRAFHESRNIAMAGCSVLGGNGKGVVFATGHETEFGKIAAMSRDIKRPLSPLQRETARLVRLLTIIAVVMGLAFFVYGIAEGRPLWVNIVFMLGIIVANVPEGLLPTFTLALSMASLRMAETKVLAKSLESVESLGAVHVVCTDKTGTLTRNELSISGMISAATGEPFADDCAVSAFLRAAMVASEVRSAHHSQSGDDQSWRGAPSDRSGNWLGDPLDVAIVDQYARRVGNPDLVLGGTHRHFPFDLAKRREAGIFIDGRQAQFAIKGAWETLRPLIGHIEPLEQTESIKGNSLITHEAMLDVCDRLVAKLSSGGKRVIAVASRELDREWEVTASEETLERGLGLFGFVLLDDPIRPEVPDAVRCCHQAGIRVVMVTGDHPDTAFAIACECGIADGDRPPHEQILQGEDLENCDDKRLCERVHSGVSVFARTTPQQKLKIVAAYKRLGCVVAMTGDGVNDMPALKAADVGIAMGVSGTDAARESADMVLLDDNFASIVSGIKEGRAVYANMQKFVTYVLASNIPEIVPFLLYILFPIPLALTVVQILSIDLGTDLLPAIGLGQDAPDHETMRRPPRSRQERLLSRSLMVRAYLFLGVIQACYSMALFFVVLVIGGWRWGDPLETSAPLYRSATGITLATIVLMQVGNVVGRRSENRCGFSLVLHHNRIIALGIFIEVVFSWAVLYWQPVQSLLGTGPVQWPLYLAAWAGIPLILGLDECRKWLGRRWWGRSREPGDHSVTGGRMSSWAW